MEYNYDSYVFIFMNLNVWFKFQPYLFLTPSQLCFHLDLAEKKKLDLDLAPPEKRDLVNL